MIYKLTISTGEIYTLKYVSMIKMANVQKTWGLKNTNQADIVMATYW